MRCGTRADRYASPEHRGHTSAPPTSTRTSLSLDTANTPDPLQLAHQRRRTVHRELVQRERRLRLAPQHQVNRRVTLVRRQRGLQLRHRLPRDRLGSNLKHQRQRPAARVVLGTRHVDRLRHRPEHTHLIVTPVHTPLHRHHSIRNELLHVHAERLREEQHLDRGVQVLNRADRPRLALLVHPTLHRRDQTRDRDLAFLRRVVHQRRDRLRRPLPQQVLRPIQRVRGHVQAEHLPLERQQDLARPLLRVVLQVRQRGRFLHRLRRRPEQIELPSSLLLLQRRHHLDGVLVHDEQRLTGVAEVVERPRLDQRLHHTLRTHRGGCLGEEVRKPGEPALLLTIADDGLRDPSTDVADRAEPEPDVPVRGGELHCRVVDVRRQHLQPHAPALGQIDSALVLLVRVRGQQSGHVLGWVVRLQVGGPVRDQPIGGGVRLVERVPSERQDRVPQRLDRLTGEPVRLHPLLEDGELLLQNLLLLLTHRPAERVGLSERVVRDLLSDLHDLLLVDDQPVGLRQDLRQRLLQLGVDRGDLLPPVLPVGVVQVRVDVHRARPVQRHAGHDVLERCRLHPLEQGLHAPTFKLEHAQRLATPEHVERCRVIHGQRQRVDLDTVVGLHHPRGVIDRGHVDQTQDVDLQQADALTLRAIPPRDDRPVLTLPQRQHVQQGLAADDVRTRVHASVADQPFQAPGGVEDLRHLGVGLDQRPHLRRFRVPLVLGVHDPRQRDVLRRHRWGESLGEPVRDREPSLPQVHAGGVLERGLRLNRAVGDDLREVLAAVLVLGVLDDLVPAALVEVDVDVGRRLTLRVQEPLENQTVLQRVDVDDVQDVRQQGTGSGATSGADADAVVLRPPHQVTDDEEVRGVALADDHLQLPFELVTVLLRHPVGEAGGNELLDLFPQHLLVSLTRHDLRLRHPVRGREHVVVRLDHARDEQGVVGGPGNLGIPVGAHLSRRFEVVAVAVELEPVRVVESLPGLHAQQRGVGVGLVLGDVVRVVRRHGPQPELLGDVQQALADRTLDGEAVVHQLQEEVLGAEDVPEVRRGLECFLRLPKP
ncbi:Na+/proline symporter [Saccharomonospora phage PIS 136]|nr:Na+/proline symporter [Saccharomonospora phage PIS 136]